jgi:transcriptional regulator with XRE-family HTH domain
MNDLFYYSNVKFKLLASIRGNVSQKDLSEKLGFNFNQVHKWEAGTKGMSLEDFSKYCLYFGISLDKHFATIFSFFCEGLDQKEIFEKMYKAFGPVDKKELAELLQVNKSTLYRWFDGKGAPDFALILYWIDKRTQYLPDLIVHLVGEQNSWSIISDKKEVVDRRLKYSQYPLLPAVEGFLHLDSYLNLDEHSNQAIADGLNISIADVVDCLAELVRCEEIIMVNGLYTINTGKTDIGHVDVASSAKLAKFWTQKCVERFNTEDGIPKGTGNSNNLWAYRVLPVPAEIEAELKEKLMICLREISELADSYEHGEGQVKALITHFFNVAD